MPPMLCVGIYSQAPESTTTRGILSLSLGIEWLGAPKRGDRSLRLKPKNFIDRGVQREPGGT